MMLLPRQARDTHAQGKPTHFKDRLFMHQAVLAINEERLVGAINAFPVSHL